MNDPNGFCCLEAAIICFISGIHWLVIISQMLGALEFDGFIALAA